MVRPKRFELLTYRFVACCSIQLSYERLGIYVCRLVVRPKRFELLTYRFVACCSIQLSYERPTAVNLGKSGADVKHFFQCKANFFESGLVREQSPHFFAGFPR